MEEAESLFEKAIEAEEAGQSEQAYLLWQRGLNLAPEAVYAWRRFGCFLYEQERWPEALTVLSHVLSGHDETEKSMAYAMAGCIHKELQVYKDAEDAFRQSLSIKPDANVWVFLYSVLLRQDRDEEAADCLREAIRLDPGHDEAHFNLGCCYKSQKNYDLAEEYLRRAIELGYEEARAYAELGFVLMRRERHARAEASRMLERAIELDPAYGWARIYLANLWWQLDNYHRAEEQYNAALAVWPETSITCWCYGDFLSQTNRDRAKGGKLLRKAVELDPKDATAHYYLGKHLLRCHRKFAARKALEEAARLGHERAQAEIKQL